MDFVKEEIENKIGRKIDDFKYYNVIKSFSKEFGTPLDVMPELKEYWFTKDPSKLSEKSIKYLHECILYFRMVSNKEGEN